MSTSNPTRDPHWTTTTSDGTNYLYDYTDKSWYKYHEGAPDRSGLFLDSKWVSADPPPGVTAPARQSPPGGTAPVPQWSPGEANRPAPKPLPTGSGPTPPKVPGGDGKGNTSVHTPSLDLFAANVKALLTPVDELVAKLKTLPAVQPGAFYHADLIRQSINGDNGDAGLKAKFHAVVTDLGSGLTDLHQAITTLSTKYKSTEEANKGTADDVSRAFNGAAGYFSGIVTDAGGGGGGG